MEMAEQARGEGRDLFSIIREQISFLVLLPVFVLLSSSPPSLQDTLLAVPALRRVALLAIRRRSALAVRLLVEEVDREGAETRSFDGMIYDVDETSIKVMRHAAAMATAKEGSVEGMMMEEMSHEGTVGGNAQKKLPPVGNRFLLRAARGHGRYLETVAGAVAQSVGAFLFVLDNSVLDALLEATLNGNMLNVHKIVARRVLRREAAREREAEEGSQEKVSEAEGTVEGPGTMRKPNLGIVSSPLASFSAMFFPHSIFSYFQALLAWILSFFFSGGRTTFAFEAIRDGIKARPGPGVIFVRNVESTLCSSPDKYDAFVEVFGCANPATAYALGAPFVAEGIIGLPRTLIIGGSTSKSRSEEESSALQVESSPDFSSLTGGAGSTVDAVKEAIRELSGMESSMLTSNECDEGAAIGRAMIDSLFITQLDLGNAAKTESQGNKRNLHMKQIAKDLENEKAEVNYQRAAEIAAFSGITIPPEDSSIYREEHKPLSKTEWSKAMSWACGIQKVCASNNNSHMTLLDSKKGVSEEDGQLLGGGEHLSVIAQGGSASGPEECIVTEEGLRYGIKMARAGQKQVAVARSDQVRPSNPYERRLLQELLQADEVGNGFMDVGALASAKDALREAVQLPLQYPALFARGNLNQPCRGVLLFGPPGTGKTLLARAAAAECGACFLSISSAAVSSKWVGDGVKNVRAAFSLARKLSPAVLFVDEVDSLLGKRDSTSEHEALREIKNEFMAQWDGIRSGRDVCSQVMVLGATNRPFDLDEAVLRRFSRRLFIDLPDYESRCGILKVLLQEDDMGDVDIGDLAKRSDGYSGSDLSSVCKAAAMHPIREMLEKTSKAKGKNISNVPELKKDKLFDNEGRLRIEDIMSDYKTMGECKDGIVPDLRPLKLNDFVRALDQVGPSVLKDGSSMDVLREWNNKYGDDSRHKWSHKHLSYFM